MASSALGTESFAGFEYTSAGGIFLMRWWNEIDGSQQWQEGVFYALCAAYALVALIALMIISEYAGATCTYSIESTRIWLDNSKGFPLDEFCGQWILFDSCAFIYLSTVRAVEFGFYWSVFHNKPKVLDMILLDLPGLLFFSTYTLLVLFWAEIYHQARSLPADRLRPAYFIVNGLVYFLQVCIWIYMRFSKGAVAVEVAELFFSVISLCAALGFIIYGGRLFVMLRRFPIESRGRQKKLHEVISMFPLGPFDVGACYQVGFVTGICCTCFLIRCVMVAVAAFNKDADIHVLSHPILDLVYYLIVEIVPSALVLFILRKLPPRRVSDHYHPIK
ncbi:protein of unknown function DUF1084 [Cynara cardunculus var. scolymus]|uniref:THH1/TOM1/TOM3 domain-containing protein n=1 Tax=Cynara cardunculus var. scolymus TaxID=59895 RepID=A0A124SF09_CYNCS|nr:protein of unknown function DUF1084 [Cynara cardunculus var. scolymus]